MRKIAAVIAAILSVFMLTMALPVSNASASSLDKAYTAIYWAETQAGKPYVWGGTGPHGYDCSGLVVAAYRKVGISLPRTTYSMLSSPKLRRESASQAKPGDLAFFGSGHVELYANNHTTFGALHSGLPLAAHSESSFWHPTAFYQVLGSRSS